jgi:formate-dependent nitrite reductase membrane component NrfD
MVSELFTAAPHWRWWAILYFFVGGIAGGSYFLSVLMELLGNESDRRLARIGYLIAFPLIALGGLLLIVDLKQPQRFWHMLIQSETFRPMFKWWSPISYGTYIISAFSAFAFVSFLAALVRPGDRPGRGPIRPLHKLVYGLGPISAAFKILGAVFALLLASYTGVLLSATNRPVWANSPMISLLFLVSAVSTAAAAIVLLGGRRRGVHRDSVHALVRMDDWLLLLELGVLIAFVFSLSRLFGSMSPEWLTGWGLGLLVVALGGVLAPLVLTWRPRSPSPRSTALAAFLVLLGGLLLRTVVVMSSEVVSRVAAH